MGHSWAGTAMHTWHDIWAERALTSRTCHMCTMVQSAQQSQHTSSVSVTVGASWSGLWSKQHGHHAQAHGHGSVIAAASSSRHSFRHWSFWVFGILGLFGTLLGTTSDHAWSRQQFYGHASRFLVHAAARPFGASRQCAKKRGGPPV